MLDINKVYQGDSLERLKQLSDSSVQLIVTSPPYWNIKDYGMAGQIGFNDSFEIYIERLNLIWQECLRVLEPGCRLCINIADVYTRTAEYGRYKIIPIVSHVVPAVEKLSFDFMGDVIWQKISNCAPTGGGSIMGSYPYPRNGMVKIDYEHILLFKKLGEQKPVDPERKEASKMTKAEWMTYFSGHWQFPGESRVDHPAPYPLEIPYRLIKMYSFIDDLVLDPFMGSGTTGDAALKANRNYIGFELNPEFVNLCNKRIYSNSTTLDQFMKEEKLAQEV